MRLIDRLGRIDSRIIYMLLILSLLIPLVNPIGLPVSVSEHTKRTYSVISTLKPGDTVIIDVGYSVSGAGDVEPQLVAILKQLFGIGVKVIFVAVQADGAMITEKLIKPWESQGLKYGEDFVNLGYLAGGENAIAMYCKDLKKSYPTDFRGNSTADLPILANVNGVKDVDMFLFFTSQNSDQYVRQVSPYGIPVIGGLINTIAPQAEPYVNTGQLAGILIGLRGGAEYETAMKSPGTAVACMDAQSMGHLLVITFVILGNLSYVLTRKNTAKKEGGR